jgi:putative transposase
MRCHTNHRFPGSCIAINPLARRATTKPRPFRLKMVAIALGKIEDTVFRPYFCALQLLVAENLCLRQQLLVLQRRQPRPYLKTVDRFFWVLASRWLGSWRNLLLVVKPKTVLKWHQRGWRLYWSWRSRMRPRTGRRPIPQQLQVLIRRMAVENSLWGQKRIQAELARLGFKVSARTVAKYMRTARHDRGPSVRWRTFLKLHASNIWACDFFCVQTLLFDTLHVFFVIQHINREVLHVAVTRHPTAEWLAQQILESCAWDRRPPRFMIHDRDSRYGPSFDRRLKRLGIKQVRTPFRCPVANAVAERWVKSAPSASTTCSCSTN